MPHNEEPRGSRDLTAGQTTDSPAADSLTAGSPTADSLATGSANADPVAADSATAGSLASRSAAAGSAATGSAATGSLPSESTATGAASADLPAVRHFWQTLGLPGLIDVHTHFMPHRLLDRIRAYFDSAGPLLGRPWPIHYRQDEAERLEILRGYGVRAFTSLAYPHKPGMAESLNAWTADFAARTPGCLHSATFFPEPEAARYVPAAVEDGARVFKAHIQVGGYDPADPLLDPVWGTLADAGVPVIAHCASGPVGTPFTGPGPMAAVLARHPALRLVVAHFGLPEYVEFLDLAERYDGVLLDTTMAFTDFFGRVDPPDHERKRIADFEERILFGSDFPNIPYPYSEALDALARLDFGDDWLRAVCHDNAARIFGL